MQGRRGVVHRDNQPPAFTLRLPVNTGDALTRKPAGHRETSQRNNDLRVDRRDLPLKVGRTGGHLIRQGVSIARRPAFHHVGDENVLSLEAGLREEFVEELTGVADEGATLPVFVPARPFSNQHHPGLGMALSRDGVGPGPGQLALRADLDLGRDLFQFDDRLRLARTLPIPHAIPQVAHHTRGGEYSETFHPLDARPGASISPAPEALTQHHPASGSGSSHRHRLRRSLTLRGSRAAGSRTAVLPPGLLERHASRVRGTRQAG